MSYTELGRNIKLMLESLSLDCTQLPKQIGAGRVYLVRLANIENWIDNQVVIVPPRRSTIGFQRSVVGAPFSSHILGWLL